MQGRVFQFALLAAALASGVLEAQTFTRTAPTAADWAALAKLPDFTGVWEAGGGGGGGGRGRGRGAAPAGPQLTPAAEARRKELPSLGREDNATANCLPPGIMGQPYPMEFLLTPGKATIVVRPMRDGSPGGMFVRAILADGRELTFAGQPVEQ